MIEFFNAKMVEAKLNTAPGNPVIAAQINLEQNFAFIEVKIVNALLCYILHDRTFSTGICCDLSLSLVWNTANQIDFYFPV